MQLPPNSNDAVRGRPDARRLLRASLDGLAEGLVYPLPAIELLQALRCPSPKQGKAANEKAPGLRRGLMFIQRG